jgi:hypothetical protein
VFDGRTYRGLLLLLLLFGALGGLDLLFGLALLALEGGKELGEQAGALGLLLLLGGSLSLTIGISGWLREQIKTLTGAASLTSSLGASAASVVGAASVAASGVGSAATGAGVSCREKKNELAGTRSESGTHFDLGLDGCRLLVRCERG